MRPLVLVLSVAFVAGIAAAAAWAVSPYFRNTTPKDSKASSVYDFTMDDIQGKPKPLGDYKGQVLLIVNVASKCGNTPQYAGLEAAYAKYKDQGFEVLGFPANKFAGQEPGSNEEILQFCQATYSVKFPMFSKVVVKGDDTVPLYRWLIDQTDDKSDIDWNFAKFLVGRDGKVIKRYKSRVKPDDPQLVADVEEALKVQP